MAEQDEQLDLNQEFKTTGLALGEVMRLLGEMFGLSEEGDHYEDPGEYDEEFETEKRSLIELLAFYDEAGPRSDPAGDYLCGTCSLRQEPDACLWVSGKISMETGSCDIYVRGNQLSDAFVLKEKYSQQKSGYAERPEARGFGCGRCEYGVEAKEPDVDGRPLWCREWGVHVMPTACCERHQGKDMVVAPEEMGEKAEIEVQGVDVETQADEGVET